MLYQGVDLEVPLALQPGVSPFKYWEKLDMLTCSIEFLGCRFLLEQITDELPARRPEAGAAAVR